MDQPPAVAFTAFTDVWPRACASSVMKVGRQAFQETSVHRIFIESCDVYLLKKPMYSSPCKNLLICFS